ncbi:hypothetical protein HOB87_07835 [Candidatus Woesearchaeota archaeon]|nr:hypothetical protein [Candidatus Woesearchaeota archaeon]
MKKLLTICLFLTFNAFAEPNVIHLNNIDIKIFNESKVQVFKDDVHMFGINCNNGILCKAFVSHVSNPEYKIFDGAVQSNNEVLELSKENVQSVVDKKVDLTFIMSSGNVSGSYANVQEFIIDSDTGAFYHVTKEYDWMRYGRQESYPYGD